MKKLRLLKDLPSRGLEAGAILNPEALNPHVVDILRDLGAIEEIIEVSDDSKALAMKVREELYTIPLSMNGEDYPAEHAVKEMKDILTRVFQLDVKDK